MTIEFRCTKCDKLLRTPEGSAGKQAKCPQCGATMTIPAQSAFTPPPHEPEYSNPGPTAPPNPYRAPSSAPQPAAQLAVGYQPTVIDFGDVFNKTWEIYKNNLGMCIVGSLLTNVCTWFSTTLLSGVMGPLADRADEPVVLLIVLVLIVAILAVTTFFILGLMKYMLAIARGEPANVAHLFQAGPLVVPGAIVFGILMLGTFVGLLFLVVPGVIFGLFFSQALFMLLDQKTSVPESFSASARAMRGNKLTVFLLWLVTMAGTLVVVMFTCGLGGLFTHPFLALLGAVIYLSVTGQATAADRPATPGFERPFGTPGLQPPT